MVGGLDIFIYCSIIYGIILPIDKYMFQDAWNHQPVYVYILYIYIICISIQNFRRDAVSQLCSAYVSFNFQVFFGSTFGPQFPRWFFWGSMVLKQLSFIPALYKIFDDLRRTGAGPWMFSLKAMDPENWERLGQAREHIMQAIAATLWWTAT